MVSPEFEKSSSFTDRRRCAQEKQGKMVVIQEKQGKMAVIQDKQGKMGEIPKQSGIKYEVLTLGKMSQNSSYPKTIFSFMTGKGKRLIKRRKALQNFKLVLKRFHRSTRLICEAI